MARGNPQIRVSRVVYEFINTKGICELEKLIFMAEKIKRQKENLRDLQTAELRAYKTAKEYERLAEQRLLDFNEELIKERFFEDFYKWSQEILSVARSVANSVWIVKKEEELKKLCRRSRTVL